MSGSQHSEGSFDPRIQGKVPTLRGFFGGLVTERGRDPTASTSQMAKKHGEEAPFAGMQRTEFWDWSPHHVVSGHRTLGTSTEGRQMAKDFHVGLATGVAQRLSFVEMPQLLALQLRGHTFGGQLADTCRRVMMCPFWTMEV